MKPLKLRDIVLIGDYKEVEDLELRSITGNKDDTKKLSGIIIKGYEMKFGETNANGERYDKKAFDDFVQSYYVEKGLNLPITIQHKDDLYHLAGRVLVMEVNSVGVYFVAYLPRIFDCYESVRARLSEGVLQGFSKEGWATDYAYKFKDNGDFDYIQIKQMTLSAVSLVATPANALSFERAQEIQNALLYRNTEKKKTLADLIRK
jgi:phage head maturation protease